MLVSSLNPGLVRDPSEGSKAENESGAPYVSSGLFLCTETHIQTCMGGGGGEKGKKKRDFKIAQLIKVFAAKMGDLS